MAEQRLQELSWPFRGVHLSDDYHHCTMHDGVAGIRPATGRLREVFHSDLHARGGGFVEQERDQLQRFIEPG